MDVNQQAEFSVLCRAQSFLDLHFVALEALNRAPARADLDQHILTIRAAAAEQQSAGARAVDQTRYKNEVHARLRHEIGRIRALAEARQADMPQLQTFKPLSRNTSDGTLEAVADGLVTSAGPYRAVFQREGFGEDFVDRFRELLGEFRLAIRARWSSQSRRSLAGRTIGLELQKAWKTIALLTALVEPDNAEHLRLQANWKEETLHAPRALLSKPKDLPALAAGEPAALLALPAGEPPAPGTAMVPVAQEQVSEATPERRGLLRLIGRLFGSEHAA